MTLLLHWLTLGDPLGEGAQGKAGRHSRGHRGKLPGKGKVRDRTERQGREGRGKGGKEEARGEASEESAGGSKKNES